jgi:unsaturated rhamnogalacturonyl hydrolase
MEKAHRPHRYFIGLAAALTLCALPSLFAATPAPVAPTPAAVSPTPAPRRGTSPGVPGAHLDYKPGQAPQFWSVATAETIMARYPDYRQAYWKDWSYVQGYMFYGFEMLYRATGDQRYLDYIKRYIDCFVDAQGVYSGDAAVALNLDNILTGSSIVALYEYTHDERYKKAAGQFLRMFDNYPRSKDGQFWHGGGPNGKANMWIDGIFMGQMFSIRYGRVIGESQRCFDEATRQITVFAKHCLKGDSGLYLHAWTEEGPEKAAWADPKTHLSPEVWSEGLGWYALIVPETLAALPQDHPKRAEVLDIYRRLAAGLKKTQAPKTGGWFMIVDKGSEPGNWIDPSGIAMFVYSLQRGIELGLLDKAEYAPVVARGYQSLFEFVRINEQGLVDVHGGGDGITIKKDFATYVGVNRVLNAKEAVAGFLWATAILEKPALEKLQKP